MEDHRKIIVAGEARSGTSLTMQIMKALGYKVAGDKFINWAYKNEEEREITRNANPEGFYEIPYIPYCGLDEEIAEMIPDEVVKLLTHGLILTKASIIRKLIYVFRQPQELIVSQRTRLNYPGDEVAWAQFDADMGYFFKYINKDWDGVCLIEYFDLMRNTKDTIGRIMHHLGRPPVVADHVANVIKPELYRSKRNQIKANKRAMTLYNLLKQIKENQHEIYIQQR